MGKRGNQAAAKAASKKPKVDPALANIMDAVKKAAHLPDQCGAMLANMLPFSLALAPDDRAECQQRVVSMVEETLGTVKSEMQTSIGAEEAALENLKARMAELVGTVKEAEAAVSARKDTLQAANASLTDATATASASFEVLTDKQSAHSKCEGMLASVQEQKSALEDAFEAHFKTPMEAGQGPHFKELEPFLKTMDIEKSMLSTLPGTCAKSKDDRGSFDQVIVEQLEKAIAVKISSLAEAVAVETSAVAESAAAVKNAETDHNTKKDMQDQATAAFETAQMEQAAADKALVEANEAVNTFQPQLEQATELSESVKAKLQSFESGPLANFNSFQAKPVVEVAPAGA